MNTYILIAFLTSILPTLTIVSLDSIGLILAVVRRKRHPQVSILAGIFFLGQVIRSVTWLAATIPFYINNGQSTVEYTTHQSTTLMDFFLPVFLFIIMLYAIFGWREQKLPPLIEILTQK